MPSPIRCITCGAVSFASPKAALHCHTCYGRLRDLLRYVWWQTRGEIVKGDDDTMIRCYLRIEKVRAIADLFVEEDR